jgi:hypothetical protein
LQEVLFVCITVHDSHTLTNPAGTAPRPNQKHANSNTPLTQNKKKKAKTLKPSIQAPTRLTLPSAPSLHKH